MKIPRNHPTLTLTLFSLIFDLFPIPSMAYPRTANFEFPFLPPQNFTLLGDSYLRNGVAGLTRESDVPSSSAGTLIYSTPIRFSDNRTNSTASFATRFSFSIVSLNPLSAVGDGLSFFISPENRTLGSPGGYLGLVNASKLTQNRFVAVEFDTRLDPYFGDPNENHVGLDINSLNSVKTADCSSVGIDLRTGISFTTWIEYSDDRKNLEVFLTRSRSKPDYPLLEMDIDLSTYFQEYMFLGFSGSTEGSTETHIIENWSFKSFGIKHFNPRIDNPHNVTDNTVVKTPPAKTAFSGGGFPRKIRLGLEVAGPVFLFAMVAFFGYISVRKWRSIRTDMSIKSEVTKRTREFSYRELKMATNRFHSSRVIGTGSFGTVYKAFLFKSRTTAAVKRSVVRSREAKAEFFGELSVIAGLRHKNLVPLLGWCVEKGELLLVYELMPYGSIDKVLYQDPDHWGFLKWKNRYKIAVGLASALAYLHQECDKLVIHRDIKASNVMLDANLNARLGDFGLARLIDHNKSPVSTLTAGTVGYLAPEYLHSGKVTDKTDVFSYGVLVLEVCCGRRPIDRETGGGQCPVNLVDWVWRLYGKGEVLEAVDKRLNGEFDEVEGRRLLMVGLSCANPDSEMRPTMRRVLQILEDEAEEVAVPPVKPTVNFPASLPMSLEDIVSSSSEDDDEAAEGSASDKTSDSTFEIYIDGSREKSLCLNRKFS